MMRATANYATVDAQERCLAGSPICRLRPNES
jgi:hypothetical protein